MTRWLPLLVLTLACGAAQPRATTTPGRPPPVDAAAARKLLGEGARALAHATAKDDARAQVLLEQAVARDPALWQARYDLGVLALRRGDGNAARTHFAEAHARAPEAAEPALALARVDPAQADALLAALLARRPDDHAVRLARAAALRARGAYDDAASEARAVLRAQPRALAPLLELARSERAAGHGKLAALVLDHAQEVAGPHAAIENERGLLARDADDLPRALACFARATSLDAHFTAAHVGQASLLLRSGDAAGAERAYRAALAALGSAPSGTDAADVRVGLAVALRAQNQHRAAQREYERVLAAQPSHPAALFNLGVLRADFLDQRKQAIAPFERYLAGAPASDPHRAEAERYLRDLRMSVGGSAP